jgi:hypothetical protein
MLIGLRQAERNVAAAGAALWQWKHTPALPPTMSVVTEPANYLDEDYGPPEEYEEDKRKMIGNGVGYSSYLLIPVDVPGPDRFARMDMAIHAQLDTLHKEHGILPATAWYNGFPDIHYTASHLVVAGLPYGSTEPDIITCLQVLATQCGAPKSIMREHPGTRLSGSELTAVIPESGVGAAIRLRCPVVCGCSSRDGPPMAWSTTMSIGRTQMMLRVMLLDEKAMGGYYEDMLRRTDSLLLNPIWMWDCGVDDSPQVSKVLIQGFHFSTSNADIVDEVDFLSCSLALAVDRGRLRTQLGTFPTPLTAEINHSTRAILADLAWKRERGAFLGIQSTQYPKRRGAHLMFQIRFVLAEDEARTINMMTALTNLTLDGSPLVAGGDPPSFSVWPLQEGGLPLLSEVSDSILSLSAGEALRTRIPWLPRIFSSAEEGHWALTMLLAHPDAGDINARCITHVKHMVANKAHIPRANSTLVRVPGHSHHTERGARDMHLRVQRANINHLTFPMAADGDGVYVDYRNMHENDLARLLYQWQLP